MVGLHLQKVLLSICNCNENSKEYNGGMISNTEEFELKKNNIEQTIL